MPILRFTCESCGLSFRKRASAETLQCDCGERARAEKTDLSVGFSADVSGSMQVQDTGMESMDLDFDRVIGEESRMKWEAIYERRKDKWDLINDNKGSNGYDLLREDDGSYLVNRQAGSVLKGHRDNAMEIIKESKTTNKES